MQAFSSAFRISAVADKFACDTMTVGVCHPGHMAANTHLVHHQFDKAIMRHTRHMADRLSRQVEKLGTYHP